MELAGIKVALTMAYHPQGDGQLERTNRTIEAMIRILTLEAPHVGWVNLLPTVELMHNSTPHTASGDSPYDLLYVACPKTFGEMSAPQAAHSNHSLRAEDWATQLKNRRDLALQAMKMAQETQKRYLTGNTHRWCFS